VALDDGGRSLLSKEEDASKQTPKESTRTYSYANSKTLQKNYVKVFSN